MSGLVYETAFVVPIEWIKKLDFIPRIQFGSPSIHP